MKDSSGDPENLEAVLKAFPGFRLYAGNETLLLRNMHLGGVGCISATANVNPRGIVELYNRWREDDADEIGRAHVELQSLMRISYAVFCLKKKTNFLIHTYKLLFLNKLD